METRTRHIRVEEELCLIRDEVLENAKRIPEGKLDWTPSEGMKSFKDLLREMGTMEAIVRGWIESGKDVSWDDAVQWRSGDLDGILNELTVIRARTLGCLRNISEEELQAPIRVVWPGLIGREAIECEELFRWIARHEYYHLGQIYSYLWILGDNPYCRE